MRTSTRRSPTVNQNKGECIRADCAFLPVNVLPPSLLPQRPVWSALLFRAHPDGANRAIAASKKGNHDVRIVGVAERLHLYASPVPQGNQTTGKIPLPFPSSQRLSPSSPCEAEFSLQGINLAFPPYVPKPSALHDPIESPADPGVRRRIAKRSRRQLRQSPVGEARLFGNTAS